MVCWGSGPILDNVTISNNLANGDGSGISTYNCNLQINNCTFIENDAPNGVGGAIFFTADTTYFGLPYQVTINNTSFLENTAGSTGGVSVNNWAWTPLIIDVTIDNCEFLDNASDHNTGLHIFDCSFSISNSVFAGNTAVGYTAGAQFGFGIGTITNCLFASNISNTGGGNLNGGGAGVWNGANVHFMNCTFADNTAFSGAGLTIGGGGTATTTNCIFWGNSTDQIALATNNNAGGTLFVNYCDVEGGENSVNVIDPLLSTLTWGIGNADTDPLFVNSGSGDYHLQDTSLCIQTAIDSIEITGVWYYCPHDDIEGNPRPYPVGTMPDMGAYEYQYLVGVEENETDQPTKYSLYQNYPNPFNPTTAIKYSVPELSFVTIKIYDVLGSELATLVNEEKPVGNYEIEFNASLLPSGVYFYRLLVIDPESSSGQGFVETKKMILLK
jgi:hypothetical protein